MYQSQRPEQEIFQDQNPLQLIIRLMISYVPYFIFLIVVVFITRAQLQIAAQQILSTPDVKYCQPESAENWRIIFGNADPGLYTCMYDTHISNMKKEEDEEKDDDDEKEVDEKSQDLGIETSDHHLTFPTSVYSTCTRG